jgi:hypothetical protein
VSVIGVSSWIGRFLLLLTVPAVHPDEIGFAGRGARFLLTGRRWFVDWLAPGLVIAKVQPRARHKKGEPGLI